MSDKEDLDFDFKEFKEVLTTNGPESSDSDEGDLSPEKLGYSSIPNFSDEEDGVTVSTTTIEEVDFDVQISEDLPNVNSALAQTTEISKEEEEKRITSMREFEERYKRDIKEHIDNVENLKRGKDFELNSGFLLYTQSDFSRLSFHHQRYYEGIYSYKGS